MVRFADSQPTRRIRTRKGQRRLPGRWWSATDGRHIGYESWLERDQLMWLDWGQPGAPPVSGVRGRCIACAGAGATGAEIIPAG